MINHLGFECPAIWKAPAIYGIMDNSLVGAYTRTEAAHLLSVFYNTTIDETTLSRLKDCFFNGNPKIIKMFEKEEVLCQT